MNPQTTNLLFLALYQRIHVEEKFVDLGIRGIFVFARQTQSSIQREEIELLRQKLKQGIFCLDFVENILENVFN